jgi:hypothetical protein
MEELRKHVLEHIRSHGWKESRATLYLSSVPFYEYIDGPEHIEEIMFHTSIT